MKIRIIIMSICLFLRIWGADNKFIASIATIGIAVMVYSMIASAITKKKGTYKGPLFRWGCFVGAVTLGIIGIYFLHKNVWGMDNFPKIAAITAILLLMPFALGVFFMTRKKGSLKFFGGVLQASSIAILSCTLLMYFLTASETTQHIAEAVMNFK